MYNVLEHKIDISHIYSRQSSTIQNNTIYGQEVPVTRVGGLPNSTRGKSILFSYYKLDNDPDRLAKTLSHVKATTMHSSGLIGLNTRVVWSGE